MIYRRGDLPKIRRLPFASFLPSRIPVTALLLIWPQSIDLPGAGFIERIYYVQLKDRLRARCCCAGAGVLGLGAAPHKKLASLDDDVADGTLVTGSAGS
jgi:hypothetical protein